MYSHPVQSPNLISRINQNRPSLRKSEAKVADFVLSNTNEVITMRIVDLASRALVSEPTVIRFCRALGFDGFQSFKLSLAQQLGPGNVYTLCSGSAGAGAAGATGGAISAARCICAVRAAAA